MTTTNIRSGSSGSAIAAVLWVLAGFALFFVLFFDPLGFHPVDGWLQHALGYHTAAGMQEMSETSEMAEGEREILFYRNPMDATVTSPVPAKDEMGMDYVPVYAEAPKNTGATEREILFYRNPMDATVTSPVPAKDEMGMDYVPVFADQTGGQVADGAVTVEIDPVVVQNMNVQSTPAERRDITREIRTVGYLEYDQERMVTVTTKYSGWVEKVYVNHVGEPVRRGQRLFEIYSPELVQTEQELLSAIAYARKFEDAPEDTRRRAQALVEAARTRLSYWDVSPQQIAKLEETGEIIRALQVVAPASGLVMKRMPGLEGAAVKPGMETYHIANLSSLWLSVEIFEDQIAWIREGTPADVTFTYFPGETFRGRVRFIEPEFSEKTRTLPVKIEVPNSGNRLRAGMFATVEFQPVTVAQALTVPSLSVLRTGQRNVVVVDLGEGRFTPREVTLGQEGAGFVEVLEGIEVGDRVVTSAQFLIDSEASVQAVIQRLLAEGRQGRKQAEPAPEAPAPAAKPTHDHGGGGHAQ